MAGHGDGGRCRRVLAVVHHLDDVLSVAQCAAALAAGADAAMLISHRGRDEEVADLAATLAAVHGRQRIGFNLLGQDAATACRRAVEAGVGHVWTDDAGITSRGVEAVGLEAYGFLKALGPVAPTHYAGVAFKGRPHEPDPCRAARHARDLGFVPTTSGPATGSPPTVEKVSAMSLALGGGDAPGAPARLAIASGMDAGNVAAFTAHATDFLVASSVALDEHRLDPAKLSAFVEAVKWGVGRRRAFLVRMEHVLHDNGPISERIEADDEAAARRKVEGTRLFRVLEIEEDFEA